MIIGVKISEKPAIFLRTVEIVHMLTEIKYADGFPTESNDIVL